MNLLRPTPLRRLLLCLLLLCGLALPPPPGPRAETAAGLTATELQAAFDQLDRLGAFFGAFAERDTNGFSSDRWRRLGANYRDNAALLGDMLARGELILDDLPPGRSSGLLDDGRIVIDSTLDGRWSPDPLLVGDAAEAAVRRRDFLEPVLMDVLARRYLPQDWPWLADHLRAIGTLGDLAQDPLARPLLARYFQAKDAYLWLAMQRISEGDPTARMALARRQAATFERVRGLRRDMAATFGAAAADRLQGDWAGYVARVDGFAVTRGWVLLDPALRRTQVGAAALAEDDAVDHAAAEMVAEAPRSAVASAAAGLELSKSQARTTAAARQPAGVNLATVIDSAKRPSVAELAARLPLESLALRPEALVPPAASTADAAAFRAFAARVKEALKEPSPQAVIAQQEAALDAASEELSALRARVGELDRGLAQRSARAAELEAALAEVRARLAEAERRAAEQSVAAQSLAGEVEELAALRGRMEELDALLAARNKEAEELALALAAERQLLAESERQRADAVAAAEAAAAAARAAAEKSQPAAPPVTAPPVSAPAAPAVETGSAQLATVLSRIEQRQLYMMGAIALMFLMALLLWLRSRRRPVAVAEPAAPLLLTAGTEVPQARAPAAAEEARPRPVIEVEEDADAETGEPPAAKDDALPEPLASLRSNGAGHRVYGVSPETREARAAMRAGAARGVAARAAKLGSESDAAAHPIVRALRKGNLPLFELLFSELTGLHAPQLQRIVYGGHGEDLAIVCRAVEVDKLLFGSIYLLTDSFRGGDGDAHSERTAEILQLYDRMSPATAKKVLVKWQRNWGEEPVNLGESPLV